MISVSIREIFPDAVDNISIKQLQDYLQVDLEWSNYENDFFFRFDDFWFWMPTDDERNVLLNERILFRKSAHHRHRGSRRADDVHLPK